MTFKSPEDARVFKSESAWQAVCAKLGQPQAMHVRVGGTLDECHEARKAVRRAVNALTISTSYRAASEEEASAYDHAAYLVARLDSFIDGFEPANTARADDFKALRTKADFDQHYGNLARAEGMSGEKFTMGEWLRGIANMATSPAVKNALTVGTDSQGGYSVPALLMPGILNALVPVSSLLTAGAGIVPLTEGAKSYTFAGINAIPTAAWRLEAGALAESDPTFRAVTAAPKSLSFAFRVSRELLADGQGLTAALYAAIAQSFAKEMDRAGLRGSGVNPEPLGIKGVAGIQTVTNGGAGTAQATIKWQNLLDAAKVILTADGPMPGACIMAPRSLTGFAGLADSTGQPLQKPDLLKDMRFISTSQIPVNLTVGASTDCTELYLGDFSQVVFMLREAPSIQPLNELYAANGQIGFACHARVDIAVLRPGVFALVTGVRA